MNAEDLPDAWSLGVQKLDDLPGGQPVLGRVFELDDEAADEGSLFLLVLLIHCRIQFRGGDSADVIVSQAVA